jgi:hypothetical protein
MHTRLTPVALALALFSGAALAQTPKPRVMVIMDTSKSMIEKPEVAIPTCPPGGGGDCVESLPNDPGTLAIPGKRGDYDPAIDNICDNKFCSAKSVVYNVIPGFTDIAHIGITTYFQYLVQSVTPDNRSTTCMYDVLAPAGTTRTFTSLFDYTGGGGADTCGGAQRVVQKPDDVFNAERPVDHARFVLWVGLLQPGEAYRDPERDAELHHQHLASDDPAGHLERHDQLVHHRDVPDRFGCGHYTGG